MSAPVRPAIGALIVAYSQLHVRVVERGPVRFDGGFERGGRGRAGLHFLPRDEAASRQRLVAAGLRPRVRRLREITRKVGLHLRERRLEWPVIQREQDLPVGDIVALIEIHRCDRAGDLCITATVDSASAVPITRISSGIAFRTTGATVTRTASSPAAARAVAAGAAPLEQPAALKIANEENENRETWRRRWSLRQPVNGLPCSWVVGLMPDSE